LRKTSCASLLIALRVVDDQFPAGSAKTFAEFFAGIGLMRLGLEQQGWKIAFANDICTEKYEMYAAHFEDATTISSSKTFISSTLMKFLQSRWQQSRFPATTSH
jgi:site-specific DNA-cytosine methylase